MPVSRQKLKALAGEVNQVFLIPSTPDELLAPIRTLIQNAPSPVSRSAEAFCTTIRSVVSTAGIPYHFAIVASQVQRYQLLKCAAELQAVVDNAPDPETTARTDAARRIRDICESREGRDALNHDACCLLLELSKEEDVKDGARHLILQGTVLIWGAFEALSRDLFRTYLNLKPGAYSRLLADPDVRRRFELSRVSIERVADFDFDLSERLGDLLVEQNDLADLAGIKATFSALFPRDEGLRSAFGQRDLWLLFQRRNLIVHRQGIVDARYVELSGDRQPVSAPLAVKPKELRRYLEVASTAVHALISAVQKSTQD